MGYGHGGMGYGGMGIWVWTWRYGLWAYGCGHTVVLTKDHPKTNSQHRLLIKKKKLGKLFRNRVAHDRKILHRAPERRMVYLPQVGPE